MLPCGPFSSCGGWGYSPAAVLRFLIRGSSCCGAQALGCMDFRSCTSRLQRAGSEVMLQGLSCSTACGIHLDQRSNLNPCLLHWQAGSLPLSHQGRPSPTFLNSLLHYQVPPLHLFYHSPYATVFIFHKHEIQKMYLSVILLLLSTLRWCTEYGVKKINVNLFTLLFFQNRSALAGLWVCIQTSYSYKRKETNAKHIAPS